MSENPIVSVIIPAYNCASTIQGCLDSLYSTSVPESAFEVIVINDGSKDNTLSLLKSQEEEHPNIIIVDQTNQGVSAARNNGLQKAKGKWVCFVDSDDTVDTEFLALPLKADNGYDLIICGYILFEDGKYVRQQKLVTKNYNSFDNFIKEQKSVFKDSCGPWAKFFSRNILVENNILFNKDLRIAEDRLFFYDFLQFVNSVRVFGLNGYNYLSTKEGLRFKKVPQTMQIMRLKLIGNAVQKINVNKGASRRGRNVLVNTYYAQVNAASISWDDCSFFSLMKDLNLISKENGLGVPIFLYLKLFVKRIIRKLHS